MEAVHISETLVYSETTWRYIPERSHLHTCCHENLKSYLGHVPGNLFLYHTSFNSTVVNLGSSVNIVSGYGLDDRAIEVRSPAEAKGFFL
jgi:hypothetical protein